MESCRWCDVPSITEHNHEGVLWVARDQSGSGWISCASHIGNAVQETFKNNSDIEPVTVELYFP